MTPCSANSLNALAPIAVLLGVAAKAPRTEAASASNHTLAGVAKGDQVAVFSGGCFWGVQAVFQHVKGVTNAVSGYAGGDAASARYDRVSEGNTGHAESVQVTFDPTQVSYEQLLQVFFAVAHDPTQLNYQGPDHGPQYRSAVWYTNDQQKARGGGLHRAADESEGLAASHRHEGVDARRVLSGRGLPPGLRHDSSESAIHRLQRRTQSRGAQEAAAGALS